jgi:hypothetical protein
LLLQQGRATGLKLEKHIVMMHETRPDTCLSAFAGCHAQNTTCDEPERKWVQILHIKSSL